MKDMTIYGSYVSPTELWNQQPMLHASITEQELQSISNNTILTNSKLYSVHNHITGTDYTLTEIELEASWPDLTNGTLEITDEIYLNQI